MHSIPNVTHILCCTSDCLERASKGLAAAVVPPTDAEGLQWSLLEVWGKTWAKCGGDRRESATAQCVDSEYLRRLRKRAPVVSLSTTPPQQRYHAAACNNFLVPERSLTCVRFATRRPGSPDRFRVSLRIELG